MFAQQSLMMTVAEPEDGMGKDEYFPGLLALNIEASVSVTYVVIKKGLSDPPLRC